MEEVGSPRFSNCLNNSLVLWGCMWIQNREKEKLKITPFSTVQIEKHD